jgi:transcriptional regulator with XRE-family HTH domain
VILAKFLRLHHGWSLESAAKQAEVTVSTLCLIERKRFVPTEPMLQKLAAAFGVTPPSSLLREVTLQDLRIADTLVAERHA